MNESRSAQKTGSRGSNRFKTLIGLESAKGEDTLSKIERSWEGEEIYKWNRTKIQK